MASPPSPSPNSPHSSSNQNPERWLLLGITLLCSVPLIFGDPFIAGIYRSREVLAGDWWRVVTHPFVHLSGYHLAIDGLAFFYLYHLLQDRKMTTRIQHLALCGAGSLGVSLLAAPQISVQGLCGLSGIAHGLMGITSLQLFRASALGSSERSAALLTLGLLCLKCGWEAVTGSAFLESWHLGHVGDPVSICHLGGLLGGLASYASVGLARAFVRVPKENKAGANGVESTTIFNFPKKKNVNRRVEVHTHANSTPCHPHSAQSPGVLGSARTAQHPVHPGG